MHILLIPSTYPTEENPVRGIFYRDQAVALARAGHRVGVLALARIASVSVLRKFLRHPVIRTYFDISDDNGAITYQITSWNLISTPTLYAKKLSKIVLSGYNDYVKNYGAPDVIHSHNSLYGGYAGAKLKESTGLPLVLTEHSSNFITRQFLPNTEYPADIAIQAADVRLAVSSALARNLQSRNPKKPFSVLGNIVDTVFFMLPDQQPEPSPFVFCAVCSLVPTKALDIMLHAFAKAFVSKNVILRIAGDGRQKQMLKELAHNLGVDTQVEFLGQLSRYGVRELLYSSHAIVSSSRVETFGVNLIEALACGKPVVATRCGGPEDFVNERNGLLATVNDVTELANVMRQMVDTWHGYDPVLIRKECVDRFSEPVIVAKLETVYQGLINK